MKQLLRGVARSFAPASARDDGFGLIEVLVSAVIVVALGATVAQALIVGTLTSADQRKRSQAAEVSQQDQERMRGLSSSQLDDLDAPQLRTVTVDGTVFSVTSRAQFISSTGGSTCGSSGAGAAAYYDISSSTNWPGNARSPVVSRSLATPPAGGTLLTQAVDQTLAPVTNAGAPILGVTVLATGPTTTSGTTDVNGCTVFPALTAGSYTLTLTDPGYVDINGNSPLTVAATVTSVGTANPSSGNPLIMGQAGLMNASFTTVPVLAGGTVTGQQAPGISWYGAGSSRNMTVYKNDDLGSGAVATAIPATPTIPLFPFAFVGNIYTNNYRVWAGACYQEEAPNGYDTYSVGPSSSQTVAVQEPALNVLVYSGTVATRVAPADVKFYYTSTAGSGPACSDNWSAPIAANAATNLNGSLQSPGQPFVTSGVPASASGFTGTLTVCADSTASGTSRFLNGTTTTNSNFNAATPVSIIIPTSGARGSCP